MHGRVALLGVVAAASVAAGGPASSVSVNDPCGDLGSADTPAGAVATQPAEWDRNDVAQLTVAEVRDAGDAVVGVDLLVGMCGETAPPSRAGEHVEVRWPVSDHCWASAAVGHGGNSVRPTSSTGLYLGPDGLRFSVRCVDPIGPYGLVGTVSDEVVVELAAERVRWEGSSVSLSLRADELGELAGLVSAGATITDATVLSYAAAGTTLAFELGPVTGAIGTVDWTPAAPPLTLGG